MSKEGSTISTGPIVSLPNEGKAIDLSIVIINWNSCEYLRRCLESVSTNLSGTKHEIIVVDNASYDGCAAMLATEFPEAVFIQSTENLGFARANNLGVARSTGRNILFLNPDTVVLGAALRTLESALEQDEQIGLLGARILNSDLSLQTTCIMPIPTLSNQLLDINLLRKLYTWWKLELRASKQERLQEVEAVSGACMMVKRSALEKAGFFCEDYFMYVEDIDLCVRVSREGWRVCHLRSAEIIHYGGGSSTLQTADHFSNVMLHESVLRFFQLHRGATYASLYRPSVAIGACLRIVALTFSGFLAKEYLRSHSSKAKWSRLLNWSLERSV